MKLVITGPLGHIGSRLLRTIPADRFSEIVLIDDLSTQRYCSLFDLPRGAPMRFVEADILTADLQRELDGAEVVIHLAALTDAMNSHGHRERVMEVNVRGTERVARACAEVGAGCVFVSTTSVYGTSASRVDEHCSPNELRPQSPYAESKLAAERLLADLGASVGLRFAILRLGTIFGWSIGMRFHTAINKFVWQACTGRPLTVWTTAMHQLRPYLHLDDAVRALWFMSAPERWDGEVYNVLTANASVARILEILRTHVPGLETTFVDSPIMNQLSFEVSDARFRALGFGYGGTLEGGITRTVEHLASLTAHASGPVIRHSSESGNPFLGLGQHGFPRARE